MAFRRRRGSAGRRRRGMSFKRRSRFKRRGIRPMRIGFRM